MKTADLLPDRVPFFHLPVEQHRHDIRHGNPLLFVIAVLCTVLFNRDLIFMTEVPSVEPNDLNNSRVPFAKEGVLKANACRIADSQFERTETSPADTVLSLCGIHLAAGCARLYPRTVTCIGVVFETKEIKEYFSSCSIAVRSSK